MASSGKVLQFPKKEQEEVNFKVFAQLVSAGEIKKASQCLQKLLNVESQTAEKACLQFSKLYVEDPGNVISETMKIRQCIAETDQNGALFLIQKVFGLSGIDSVVALEAIKKLG